MEVTIPNLVQAYNEQKFIKLGYIQPEYPIEHWCYNCDRNVVKSQDIHSGIWFYTIWDNKLQGLCQKCYDEFLACEFYRKK